MRDTAAVVQSASADAVPVQENIPKVNGSHTELLLRVGERFGLPIVLCLLILWWARNDIVQPLLDAHFQVIGQIVEGQRMHTDKLDTLGRKLDELIRVTEKR